VHSVGELSCKAGETYLKVGRGRWRALDPSVPPFVFFSSGAFFSFAFSRCNLFMCCLFWCVYVSFPCCVLFVGFLSGFSAQDEDDGDEGVRCCWLNGRNTNCNWTPEFLVISTK